MHAPTETREDSAPGEELRELHADVDSALERYEGVRREASEALKLKRVGYLMAELLDLAHDLQDARGPQKARVPEGTSWRWAAAKRKAVAALLEALEATEALFKKLNAPGTTPGELYLAEDTAAALGETANKGAMDLLWPERTLNDCDFYEEWARDRKSPGIAAFYARILPVARAMARRNRAAVARWRTCTRARRGGGRPRRRPRARARGSDEGEGEPAHARSNDDLARAVLA
jgi:hypothetical protein